MKEPSTPATNNIWPAEYLATAPGDSPPDVPLKGDPAWRPLRQNWVASGPEAGFQPGWARIRWTPTLLVYEAVLAGHGMKNSARRLNERTWETGDVCEIFLQVEDAPFYLEIHVTPENQRLQLRFPFDGLAAVRAGRVRLEEFMIGDSTWVQTATRLTPTQLIVRSLIPASILGGRQITLGSSSRIRTAVCRYDYRGRAGEPILSSTAPLRAPSFHDRADWDLLKLFSPGIAVS